LFYLSYGLFLWGAKCLNGLIQDLKSKSEIMGEFWEKFLFGFCKVDAVCWQGDPNWLGWIILFIVGAIVAVIVIMILDVVLSIKLW